MVVTGASGVSPLVSKAGEGGRKREQYKNYGFLFLFFFVVVFCSFHVSFSSSVPSSFCVIG